MKHILGMIIALVAVNLNASDLKVVVEKVDGGYAIVKTGKVKNADLVGSMEQGIDDVEKAIKALKLEAAGPAFLRTLDADAKTYHFQVGYQVNKKIKNLVGFDVIALPKGNVAKVDFVGDVRESYKAYDAIKAWAKKNKRTITGKPIEYMLVDMMKVAPPNQKVTVVYPIK